MSEKEITQDDLQGTWEYSQGHSDKIKYIFSGNKIDFYTDDKWHFEGTFTINGSTLIITFSDGSSSSDNEISFSGNNLTIINEGHKTNATYNKISSSDSRTSIGALQNSTGGDNGDGIGIGKILMWVGIGITVIILVAMCYSC